MASRFSFRRSRRVTAQAPRVTPHGPPAHHGEGLERLPVIHAEMLVAEQRTGSSRLHFGHGRVGRRWPCSSNQMGGVINIHRKG